MCCQFFFQFLNCLLFYIVIKLQILFVYFIDTDSSTLKTTSLSIKYQATPQMFSNRTNTTWSLRPTTMNTSTMLMKPEFLTYTLLAAHLTSLWTYVKRLKQYFFMHSVKYWWLEFIEINIIGMKISRLRHSTRLISLEPKRGSKIQARVGVAHVDITAMECKVITKMSLWRRRRMVIFESWSALGAYFGLFLKGINFRSRVINHGRVTTNNAPYSTPM